MADPDARDAQEPSPPTALPATQELTGRIGWLIQLRWLAVGGSAACVEIGRRFLPLQIHPRPLYTVIGILAAYNLIAFVAFPRVRARGARGDRAAAERGTPLSAGPVARFFLPPAPTGVVHGREAGAVALFANFQVTVDLVILAALLHFAGGIENPAAMFFVFHVIIASILLSRPATYVHATLGLLLVTAVALGELSGVLPHYGLGGPWRPDAYLNAPLVGAQLFLLGVTLYATAYTGSAIAVRLRWRELETVILSRQLADKAERLQAAYTEVRAAERVKSQYMRKVAHELRGPLGTVKTALSVVLGTPSDGVTGQTRELIEMAHRRAGELAAVTHELLALARARGSRATMERAPVDLAAVAGLVLDKLRLGADARRITMTLEADPDVGEVVGNGEALGDLMHNLLENAIRYNPVGGSVRLGLRALPDAVTIEVQDTGIGIPAEDLPRIFEEFYRSQAAREFAHDGSGLGMAIVKAVVDQHGGSIAVDSTPGRGTRVTVRLPRSGVP